MKKTITIFSITFVLILVLVVYVFFSERFSDNEVNSGMSSTSISNDVIINFNGMPKAEEELQEIAFWILYRAHMSETGRPYTVQDVDEMWGVNKILSTFKCEDVFNDKYRFEFLKADSEYSYSVYENNDVGKLFVFYKNIDNELFALRVAICKQRLEFNDFSKLVPYKHTIEDVQKIDSTTDFSYKYLSSPIYEPKTESSELSGVSVHMTLEGFVLIGYVDVNGTKYIDCIEKIEDPLIQSVWNDRERQSMDG